MTKKTHLVLLLDESGSMGGKEEAVIDGANEFIKSNADRKGRTWITLFDDASWFTGKDDPAIENVRHIVDGAKHKSVEPLRRDQYSPRGATPLYDAIGLTIRRVAKAVDKEDGVFFVILTDGMENMSKEFTAQSVAKLTKKYEERGWVFTYIGANQKAEQEAHKIGIRRKGTAYNFTASPEKTRSALRAVANLHSVHATQGYDAFSDLSAGVYDTTGGNLDNAEATK